MEAECKAWNKQISSEIKNTINCTPTWFYFAVKSQPNSLYRNARNADLEGILGAGLMQITM